jgi:EAL domain-containing protein (putative c-di-GMP-specific phosphodiesterase class I)
MSASTAPASAISRTGDGWEAAVRDILREPDRVTMWFQPILDLARGVVCGFEALARLDHPLRAAPPQWLAAAARHGLGDAFEASLIRAALARRRELPPNCFLTVNVSPTALTSPEVQAELDIAGSLGGVVVEITEHVPVADYDLVRGVIEALRGRGAQIAVDDAGAGYASLTHITAIRPEFIKLDRKLSSEIHTDPAKLALVEAVGAFAGRIDAWLVAEGIERRGELATLIGLHVPLGQGFALGRPAPAMDAQPRGVAVVRSLLARAPARTALPAKLLDRPQPVSAAAPAAAVRERLADDEGLTHLPVCDEHGRPVALRGADGEAVPVLRASLDEPPGALAQRAMTRPAALRFHPVACIGETGRYLGLMRIERLVDVLARSVHPVHPDPEEGTPR